MKFANGFSYKRAGVSFVLMAPPGASYIYRSRDDDAAVGLVDIRRSHSPIVPPPAITSQVVETNEPTTTPTPPALVIFCGMGAFVPGQIILLYGSLNYMIIHNKFVRPTE